jgi:hypothetical protein
LLPDLKRVDVVYRRFKWYLQKQVDRNFEQEKIAPNLIFEGDPKPSFFAKRGF